MNGQRPLPVEYVLPIKATSADDTHDLTAYLTWLATVADVTVVDGSPAEVFDAHAARWGAVTRHVAPDSDLDFANGKVTGVHTGLRLARHEHVIIADDDVRYDAAALLAVHRLLERHDLVRPQNFFSPLSWHARWDTARSLLNRSLGGDYPGTLGIRRSTFVAMGGYDGNALFENLELIRTVHAVGGSEADGRHIYVRRRPPDVRRFLSQRVRQAYDDLAQPVRQAAFLAVLPATLAALARRRRWPILAAAVAVVALAEYGRRQAGGARVFPASAALLAPAWVLERATFAWAALWLRLRRGGVRYGDRRLHLAAHSLADLRARATQTTITPYQDGPLLVRGSFTLQTPDGQSIDPGRATVALCRCGKSGAKPFCDGTHKIAGSTGIACRRVRRGSGSARPSQAGQGLDR